MRYFVILLLAFLLVPLSVQAATLTAADCEEASIQTQLDAAVNGDTVVVPAGNCTWTTSVSWANKNITLQGAGVDVTNITVSNLSLALYVSMTTANTTYSWRVTGFTFLGSHTSTIVVSSNTAVGYTKGWRIDHVKIHNTTSSGSFAIFIYGITWGLFDHITVDGAPSPILIQNGYMNTAAEDGTCTPHCFGYNYWNRPTNLGSDEAVYFEDSTVSFDGSAAYGLNDMEYGGSIVIRYSTINGAYIQTHSTRGNALGGMKYEVYNNTFTGSSAFSRWAQMRSGTGVIFNNTVTGYGSAGGGNIIEIDDQRAAASTDAVCAVHTAPLGACDGTSAYDGNTQNGWQCISGIGRGGVSSWNETGGTQVSLPLYGWKNGTTSTCATGGACNNTATINLDSPCDTTALATRIKSNLAPHSNGEYDYVNNGDTAKPGYAAFTYPHPLQGVVAYSPGSSGVGSFTITGAASFQ